LRGPIDTLLVAGGTGVEEAAQSEELVLWLRKTAQRVRRIGSICTGAFLLAEAGLLDGKRAATHWNWAAKLANQYKQITVDPDPIYIRDGNTYTTAGVTAGMDLALALVEEDLGSPMALQVARELVLYLRRTGGQSQFSAALSLQASDRKQIEETRSWILDNLEQDLPVERLAAKAGMSPRHFARIFSRIQAQLRPISWSACALKPRGDDSRSRGTNWKKLPTIVVLAQSKLCVAHFFAFSAFLQTSIGTGSRTLRQTDSKQGVKKIMNRREWLQRSAVFGFGAAIPFAAINLYTGATPAKAESSVEDNPADSPNPL